MAYKVEVANNTLFYFIKFELIRKKKITLNFRGFLFRHRWYLLTAFHILSISMYSLHCCVPFLKIHVSLGRTNIE